MSPVANSSKIAPQIAAEARRRKRRSLWASIAMAGALIALWLIVIWPVYAHAAPISKEQKLLNAMLNKRHPDGKGPLSTSRGKGYYKGIGGQWKSR